MEGKVFGRICMEWIKIACILALLPRQVHTEQALVRSGFRRGRLLPGK